LRTCSRCTAGTVFRILPQVLPPHQLVGFTDTRILERKTCVETTIVLLLEHTSFHDLGCPQDLPGILRNVLHRPTPVLRIHTHVIELVNIQRGRLDATNNLFAITTQRSIQHMRVLVTNLNPIVECGIVGPAITISIHQSHIQASAVRIDRHIGSIGRTVQFRKNHGRKSSRNKGGR
jgi:hypothetical protein